jgi:hypothetical protein
MIKWNKRGLSGFLAAAAFVGFSSTTAQADELVIDFVADLLPSGYTGPADVSPFTVGSQLYVANQADPDFLRADVQFVVKDFDPTFTGTYSFGAESDPSDPGVEFLLHSPMLERLEAYTTRIGSNSPTYSTNTKILLPRRPDTTTSDKNTPPWTTTGFFGAATLTVVGGVPTSLSYTQGADNLASFDYILAPNSLESLSVTASSFSLDATYDLDTPGAADAAPLGLNAIASMQPGGTVGDTTRGIIAAELAAAFAGGGTGNLLDGKESSGGQPIAYNPLDGTGTLYSYSATGAVIGVTAVPEPGTALLMMLGLSGLAATSRKRA